MTESIFGQAEEGDGKKGQAGAVAFTDARILAFPVRSQVAPFVWVTCPAVLSRLRRDLNLGNSPIIIPDLAPQDQNGYLCISGNISGPVVLEDLAVSPETPKEPEKIRQLAAAFDTLTGKRVTRLLLISDANFKFLVENATEIQPQIAIDFDTGTTKRVAALPGAPAGGLCPLLPGFLCPGTGAGGNGLLPETIQQCLNQAVSSHLQLGGDLTLGRGLMEVIWHQQPKQQ